MAFRGLSTRGSEVWYRVGFVGIRRALGTVGSLETEESYLLEAWEDSAIDEERLQSFMHHHVSNGRWESAFSSFQRIMGMYPDYKMSIRTYNIALRALSYGPRVEEAFALVQEALSHNEKLDVDSYNQMIALCMRNLHFEKAREIYEGLLSSEVTPNVFTFRILILGHCRHSQYNQAIRFLRDMSHHGVKQTDDLRMALQSYPELIRRISSVSTLPPPPSSPPSSLKE